MRTKKAKNGRKARLNQITKAQVKRQGASSGMKVPKSVLNSIESARKSLVKAQLFLGASAKGSTRKKAKAKIGRPRKTDTEHSTPS